MVAFVNEQGTEDMETNGGWRKVLPSNETKDGTSPARPGGLGNMTMSSARGQPQRSNMRPSIDKTARGGDDGFMPGASLAPQPASLGKAPIGNKAALMNKAADRNNDRQRKESSNDGRQDVGDETAAGLNPKRGFVGAPVSGTPWRGSDAAHSPHESLIPKPLAVGGSGVSGRQRVREKSAESGWWGALDSVISRPQAEYDPSNVL
jgi:hypothetical protein